MHTYHSKFAAVVVSLACLAGVGGSITSPAAAQSCNPGGGNSARSVEFANLGATAVDVKWVNFQCGETLYTTLRGGGSYVQQTYVSHLWRFYEVGTGRLLKEERIVDQTRIEFGDPSTVTTKPAEVVTLPPATNAPAGVPTFPGAGDPRTRARNDQPCNPGGGNLRQDVTFKNVSASTIEVWWVNFDCTEKLYATLPPGAQYVQQTYVTHQWRFYEAPGGPVSSIVCAAIPADQQCIYPTQAGGGSVVFRTDLITQGMALIEVSLPTKFDPRWRPVVKAKASGANTVVFSWAIPAGAPGACYSFNAVVKRGTVEQAKSQACIPIPANRSTPMSVSVALDSGAVTRARQTKQPLKYNASVALSLDVVGGVGTGLPGTVAK